MEASVINTLGEWAAKNLGALPQDLREAISASRSSDRSEADLSQAGPSGSNVSSNGELILIIFRLSNKYM